VKKGMEDERKERKGSINTPLWVSSTSIFKPIMVSSRD